ncbi:uncharacterized protein K02A2.6-like [Actinia tenebrosa]|uniref:Uncharacterized protein K02A2.6-like n=1 Tax=Actinia tenebrosa TaxID=6105 RepID=A0A6P8I7Y2_ACTTE|nr:uncharacterized protein K02A2.6-like [Actinia tenebrosa]
MVVPRALGGEVLEDIHGAHLRVTKSLSFAKDYVFWPSMTAHIKDKVNSCAICNAFRNQQQRESLHPHDIPGLPWQVVGTDIVKYGGYSYLLVTDFYSKCFEIKSLRQITATCVINNLKKIFARFGIPAEVVSDNGSQYSNTGNLFNSTHEFKRFAEEWGFRHTTSSPEYPHSNGAAERAVQTAKRILKKAEADKKDPFEGLLKYRNTPFDDIGVPPAQLLMSRRTHTTLPTHRRLLVPRAVEPGHVQKALKQRQDVSKANYDKRSRDLPPLQAGEKVRIRPNQAKEWRKAEVLPRSYVVRDVQGHTYRRDRRQIIAVPNDQHMIPQFKTTFTSPRPKDPPTKTHDEKTHSVLPPPISEGISEKPKSPVHHLPMATRSGRPVKKPQRLIKQC